MKEKKLPLYFIFSALFFLTATTYAQESLPPDIEQILNRRKLIIAMPSTDAPPFFMKDSTGSFLGLDVELAHLAARTMGVDIEIRRDEDTFDKVLAAVSRGEADVAIAALSQTPRRALRVKFSSPYATLRHAALINRMKTSSMDRSLPISEWLNSSEIALGTVKGSSYVEYAQRDFPKVQVVQFPTFAKAAEAVQKGDIHVAFYYDKAIANWATHNPQQMIYVQAAIFENTRDEIAMAVSWKNTHLLSWLNLFLSNTKANGTLAKLHEVYLQTNDWDADSPGGAK